MRRLRARTFRWNAPGDVDGYFAAEVEGDRVRWFAWSHLPGEGERVIATTSAEACRTSGPPIEVPASILAQILALLDPSDRA